MGDVAQLIPPSEWAQLSVRERADILAERLGGLKCNDGRRWKNSVPPSYWLLKMPFGEYEVQFADPTRSYDIVAILHEECRPLADAFDLLRAHQFAAANGLGCMVLDSDYHGIHEPGQSVCVLYWRKDWKEGFSSEPDQDVFGDSTASTARLGLADRCAPHPESRDRFREARWTEDDVDGSPVLDLQDESVTFEFRRLYKSGRLLMGCRHKDGVWAALATEDGERDLLRYVAEVALPEPSRRRYYGEGHGEELQVGGWTASIVLNGRRGDKPVHITGLGYFTESQVRDLAALVIAAYFEAGMPF